MRRLLPLIALAACTAKPHEALIVHVAPEHAAVFEDLVAWSGHPGLSLEVHDDPVRKARGRGLHVAVVDDGSCDGCFVVDGTKRRYEVRGGGVLGMQYGLVALLEEMGFRFHHPLHPVAPETFLRPDELEGLLGVAHQPEIDRRGLHMHTLHPIEGLYDFWLPDTDGGLERARRVVDWVVRNRGNHLQWVALDDISRSSLQRAAWQEHTAAILDYAHARGVTTGLGIQLFGTSNLQLAFDLVDTPTTPEADKASMVERLHQITDATDFDLLNLSFGEFLGEDPATFVAAANDAYDTMQEVAPGVEVTTVIHVGNYDDLRITYQGEELLYYFLVKYANPAMIPWVHSVMYYNLFEDAGLAYLHDAFDEHRAFLLERLEAGEPVGYFPESAYWVAFDVNVPYYAPLYIRSRFHDLDQIRAHVRATGASPLEDHVLFSSGWEWGYWQNDVTTLRMGYTLGEDWREHVHHLFAPWDDGPALSEAIIALTELQHAHLLEGRLAAYLAGREAVIDFGDSIGILSQPDRPSVEELVAMEPAERAAFADQVLGPLEGLASESRAIADALGTLDTSDRYVAEVADGVEIFAVRAAFAHAVWSAAHQFATDGTDGGHLARADAVLSEARAIVDRRHADLHHPDPRLIQPRDVNPTLYQFGYLARAEDLCFWERERVQVRNVVLGESGAVPGCAS